jgi:hypothetical protein
VADELDAGLAELAALERRLARARERAVPEETTAITAETLACHGGREHRSQLAVILDAAIYIILLCSRRAGKTAGLARKVLLRCLQRSRQNVLYVGLSKPHARKFFWNEIWRPLLLALAIPCKTVEDEMTTTFPNGSIVYVSGTDDVRHIESFLGNRLDLAIVDEAQSSSDAVLVPLITRILPNALLDDMNNPGQLILAGTVPDVNAGAFMRVWNENRYSRHNWNRFDNPYLSDQQKALAEYLRANPGLTVDSPVVQREWFGRFVFDSSATAYTYDPDLNGYDPELPPWLEEERLVVPRGTLLASVPWQGVDLVSCSLDPGTVDRSSVQVNGWGKGNPSVQHLLDWTSPRDARLSWDDLGKVLGVVQRRYRPAWWSYDAGSSKNELDIFGRVYGVPVVKAADKADLAGQVRLVNLLLTTGKLKVMRGSTLEEDLQKSRWDPDARAKGLWRWASAWHPDPADANRYSLAPYFDAYVAPPPEPTSDLERHRAEVRAMLREIEDREDAERDWTRDV